jgi:hypothetical protein
MDYAGKKSFANELAVRDVLSVEDTISHQLLQEIKEAFGHKTFDVIILDDLNMNLYDSIPGYALSGVINRGLKAYHTFYGPNPAYPHYVLTPTP